MNITTIIDTSTAVPSTKSVRFICRNHSITQALCAVKACRDRWWHRAGSGRSSGNHRRFL